MCAVEPLKIPLQDVHFLLSKQRTSIENYLYKTYASIGEALSFVSTGVKEFLLYDIFTYLSFPLLFFAAGSISSLASIFVARGWRGAMGSFSFLCFLFQQSGLTFMRSSAISFAMREYSSLFSSFSSFQRSPKILLIALQRKIIYDD